LPLAGLEQARRFDERALGPPGAGVLKTRAPLRRFVTGPDGHNPEAVCHLATEAMP
jgi:hypothetical protein